MRSLIYNTNEHTVPVSYGLVEGAESS
jgi:hypothetical protein